MNKKQENSWSQLYTFDRTKMPHQFSTADYFTLTSNCVERELAATESGLLKANHRRIIMSAVKTQQMGLSLASSPFKGESGQLLNIFSSDRLNCLWCQALQLAPGYPPLRRPLHCTRASFDSLCTSPWGKGTLCTSLFLI